MIAAFSTADILNTPDPSAQAERLEELRERLKQAELDLGPINQEFVWIQLSLSAATLRRDKALKEYQQHLESMLEVKL